MMFRAFRPAALLPMLLCSPFALAQAPTVSGIELRGASDATFVRYITVKVGEPVDAEAVRSSVLLLSAMDLFDEVSAVQETGDAGRVRIVFQVVETPRLGELIFLTQPAEGSPDAPLDSGVAKALAKASALRPGEPFRARSLIDARERMTAWLRANAYPRASVEVEPMSVSRAIDHAASLSDISVRVLQAKRETLVSSRIDGWPPTLMSPKSPAHPGDALTDDTVKAWKDELLALLWKAAHYRAQIRTESVAGDLVFFVTPGARFDLKLDLLSETEREKARKRFEQEGLSQDAIEETMSTIESDFVKRGYRDVAVDFQEAPTGDRSVGEFVVRPGLAWAVGGIEYQTDGVLSPRVSGLAIGVPWLDSEIAAERTRLLIELIQQGYAGATVSHEESGEPGSARVVFKIVPGSLTTVESVAIEGAPALKDRTRESVVELLTREKKPFRARDVARDRSALLTSLRDDGYVDVSVEATTEFSDDRTQVAVVFQVTPGPRVRVGRILVVGLEDTKPLVVLRESRMKEGDFLSYQKILDTQSSLSATGLFTNVQIRELAGEKDERNLIIEVKEGPRTTLVPGLGYAQTESWRASVELTRLNISGLGRTASVFLRGSLAGSTKALLSLTEPYAFHKRQSVNLQTYYDDDRSRAAFEFHRLGFQTETVFRLHRGSLLARYTFQKTTTTNVATDCAEVNRALCDGKISGPSLVFIHDTRNDAIVPHQGTFYSLETLLSLAAIGGDSFLKGSGFLARYEEVRKGIVLAGALRMGFSTALGASDELPLPERFFAGGASVMRGFPTDGVGPGRFNAAHLFVPAGGNALVYAALEARIDVARSFGFQIFAETGNVFARAPQIRLGQLREVAGIGVTYRSPFGPLRLDWGFKLDRRPGESSQQLHLGVGYAF
ncbi:MAG: BamA/TamA family outer membrane protein [Vicinamibacteria bacterium]